jgi:hypothetical protein
MPVTLRERWHRRADSASEFATRRQKWESTVTRPMRSRQSHSVWRDYCGQLVRLPIESSAVIES